MLSRTWLNSTILVLRNLAQWLTVQCRIGWLKLKRLFVPVAIPKSAEGKLYLHLGCGKIDHERFINIDGYPYPHVDYIQSIDKLPQFAEASVDLIYASHCLEHFSYTQTKSVLEEWSRVLKKGGILRLSVPDFDKLVEIYNVHDRDPDVILPQLMGGQNNKYNYHLTALSMRNLSKLLAATGFSKIQEWQPGTDALTTFNDFSVYKKDIAGRLYEVSLNIEAIK